MVVSGDTLDLLLIICARYLSLFNLGSLEASRKASLLAIRFGAVIILKVIYFEILVSFFSLKRFDENHLTLLKSSYFKKIFFADSDSFPEKFCW